MKGYLFVKVLGLIFVLFLFQKVALELQPLRCQAVLDYGGGVMFGVVF